MFKHFVPSESTIDGISFAIFPASWGRHISLIFLPQGLANFSSCRIVRQFSPIPGSLFITGHESSSACVFDKVQYFGGHGDFVIFLASNVFIL